MAPHARAHFSSSINELSRMLFWIRKHLTDAGIDASAAQKIEVASEEAIVNAIRHAYRDQEGRIDLFFTSNPQGVEISIVDRGPPFDPLTGAPTVDLTNPLEERKEGGLGIFLMRRCVDDVRYRREEGANVLTLIKHFSRTK